jgi:glycerol-3-phosphate acyltransferase PlsY
MTYGIFALAIAAAYLLGSVPFGLLIARAHGKDLRAIGSGNIGATNVARALGRKWAYVCFVLDLLKGLVPTLAASLLVTWHGLPARENTARMAVPHQASGIEHQILLWLWLAVGCAAILGHIFPAYLRFRGGKGVATSFGVALGVWPYYTISAAVAGVVWVVVVLIWRYVSLASVAGAVAFAVVLFASVILIPGWDASTLWPLLIVATIIPLTVIIRHRTNIKRLLSGTESKIGQKKVTVA